MIARPAHLAVSEIIRQVYVPTDRMPGPAASSTGELLGLIAYGSLPGSLGPQCVPCAEIQLVELGSSSRLEAWYASGPVQYGEAEGVRYAADGSVLFGVVRVAADHPDIAACESYRRIVRVTRSLEYPTIVRMWNYLPDINREQLGLERYRRFCIGRYQAFEESGFAFGADLPAASAIGTASGDLWVIFVAGRGDATQIENPCQISAYCYPPAYGPRSPSFSRAMVFDTDGGKILFISGTASILGHETVNPGDPVGQCETTVANLRTLLERAGAGAPSVLGTLASWKVYLRHSADFEAVRGSLGDALDPASPIHYLAGDICRDDLLVEIEGVVHL